MKSAFVDTSVLLHAVGGAHPQRDAARALLAHGAGDLTIHVGAETIREFLFHRLRIGQRGSAVQLTGWLLDLVVVHAFDAEVARGALDLVRAGGVGGRDAVLAATALSAGFDTLVTHDKRFVTAPGLRLLTAEQYLAEHFGGTKATPRPL